MRMRRKQGTYFASVIVLAMIMCVDRVSPEVDGGGCGGDAFAEILHPANGQTISAPWQRLLIVSVRCRGQQLGTSEKLPRDIKLTVLINDKIVLRTDEVPSAIHLPELPDGDYTFAAALEQSIAPLVGADDEQQVQHGAASTSEDAESEYISWHEISASHARRATAVPPLHDFSASNAREGGSFPPSIFSSTYKGGGGQGELHHHHHQQQQQQQHGHQHDGRRHADDGSLGDLCVVWTCPDWEEDWVSEILNRGGVGFRIVQDRNLSLVFPPNSNLLVTLSENDERNRHPAQVQIYPIPSLYALLITPPSPQKTTCRNTRGVHTEINSRAPIHATRRLSSGMLCPMTMCLSAPILLPLVFKGKAPS
jgi:hypothetical protein